MPIQVLDCTIRDGGHLNKWFFDPIAVKAAHYAAQMAGADYFEIGYRYPPETQNVGDFAICTDDFLFNLIKTPGKCKLTVMIDAGKCRTDYFLPCHPTQTLIQAVRVAAYPYELTLAMAQIEDLYAKGYEVFLNLMASSELGDEEFAYLQQWPNKHLVSTLCFADSFGSFLPADITALVAKLLPLGFKRLGFHSHNNLQMAFANSLQSIEEGVEVIDASIFGMGRGAGNLPIEVLLGYLEKNGDERYNVVPYIDVIYRFFSSLQAQIGWGYKLQALMSGLSNVHPYYVDALFESGIYTADEIWNALEEIRESCPISFSAKELKSAMDKRFYTPLTKDNATEVIRNISERMHTYVEDDAEWVEKFPLENVHSGRNILIIANGPSILKQRSRILDFAKAKNCVIIGVNNLGGLFNTDYHVFVSRRRFEQYVNSVSDQSKLILPSYFGRSFVQSLTDKQTVYFNCVAPCDENKSPVENATQYFEHLNVAISGILLAYQMGASAIFAVGMDGYVSESEKKMVYFYNEENMIEDKQTASMRYELMSKEMARVYAFLQSQSVPFSILTNTSHRKYFCSFTNP